MPVTIVTDSTCDLKKDFTDQKGIYVVPLQVSFETQTFRDGVTMNTAGLYQRLKGDVRVTTSQPTPQDFINTYSSIKGEILSIHLASVLSGTYNAALKAKELMGEDGKRITVFDSDMVTLGLGLMVIAANSCAQQGMTVADIITNISEVRRNTHILFTLTNLDYLYRGGRIGKAEATLGSMLKVRPLLTYSNHRVTTIAKCFGTEQAMSKLIAIAKKDHDFSPIKRMYVAHGDAPELRDQLEAKVRAAFPDIPEVYYGEVGAVIAAHAGGGSIGLMYCS